MPERNRKEEESGSAFNRICDSVLALKVLLDSFFDTADKLRELPILIYLHEGIFFLFSLFFHGMML